MLCFLFVVVCIVFAFWKASDDTVKQEEEAAEIARMQQENELKRKEAEEKRKEEERRREEERKEEEQRQKEWLIVNKLHRLCAVSENIRYFFLLEGEEVSSYVAEGNKLKENMASAEKMNCELPSSKAFASNQMDDCKKRIEEFRTFGEKVAKEKKNILFDPNRYGMADQDMIKQILALKKNRLDFRLLDLQKMLDDKSEQSKLWTADLSILMKAVWFYGMYKPYSVNDFEKAKQLVRRVFRELSMEVFIAELYAINQMGGDDVFRRKIDDYLRDDKIPAYDVKKGANVSHGIVRGMDELTMMASALMWMKAYEAEEKVLQYMLSHQLPMSAKLQERLHSLSNGGGNAPTGHDVQTNQKELYLDVTALKWGETEYHGLFENLSFEEKKLTYSLAVRSEDQAVTVMQSVVMPSGEELEKKLQELFVIEYGTSVTVKTINCVVMAGNNRETLEGILVETNECPHMGIYVHVTRIAKRIAIKFYTVLLPVGKSMEEQKQQALSLANELSPTATVWEKSLKESILLGIQQLLNQVGKRTGGPGQIGGVEF